MALAQKRYRQKAKLGVENTPAVLTGLEEHFMKTTFSFDKRANFKVPNQDIWSTLSIIGGKLIFFRLPWDYLSFPEFPTFLFPVLLIFKFSLSIKASWTQLECCG